MFKGNLPRSATVVSGVFMLLLLLFTGYRIFFRPTPAVVMPQIDPASPSGEDLPGTDGKGSLKVEITTDNVQEIISNLTRPAQYRREIETELFYGENESGVTRSKVTVTEEGAKVEQQLPGGRGRTVVLWKDTLYLWYGTERKYMERPVSEGVEDVIQHIPTYETVLEAPGDAITQAGYVNWKGSSCVYVEFVAEPMGYTERYWVETRSGLLVHAETLKEGRMIYQMSASETEQSTGEEISFVLPDGKVLYEAKSQAQ